MGKRVKRSVELRQNKRRKQGDSQLRGSLFNKMDGELEEEDDGVVEEEEIADYEAKPRRFDDQNEDLVEGLPVRSSDGTIHRVVMKKEERKTKRLQDEEQKELEEEQEQEQEEREQEEQASKEDGKNSVFDESNDEKYKDLSAAEMVLKIKEDLADMAQSMIEDPEENVMLMSRVLTMMTSKNPIIAKLSLLSLVPVFKSISPSYRIRPLTEAERKEKMSKDVQRTRFFEQNLVSYYQKYLKFLARKASVVINSPRASNLDKQMGIVATRAACELTESLRFFNFRSDLFKLLIRRVMRKPSSESEHDAFRRCISTLEGLLVEDFESGDVSFDIVRIVCRSIRHRDFKVDESVVNIFLSLTVLSDYDPLRKEDEKEEEAKMRKKDRVYLTRKQRAQLKERKLIEKEWDQAEQKVTSQQRERFQAQILKLLLTLYLEILRGRPEKLMAPVLEGLAKYGHQVNLDLMGDFLQVLREISEDLLTNQMSGKGITGNQMRQVLLCIITSFSLVSYMPPKKVHLDLNKFVDYLYSLLPMLSQDADIEFSHKTLRLMDPLSTQLQMKPSVNVSTEAELLLRCADAIFLSSRSGSEARALAFTKRFYLDMLNFPEKTSIAILKFIDKLMSRYDEIKCLYTTEDRIQNGVYHSYADSVERANTEVAVLWENVLLEKHYNPTVSMAAKALLKRAKARNAI
ncbi:hypothetical protein FOA43_000432 [Brettanomyces nanus]|uniref:Nucleolar complex-associated protein 3 n=1 Tax=Eeniella nana TaxID=13502 RepID=A0A875RT38_EENNA|nr:uncharacterized protein FOA43_000432 [Brettanomyces nanus]QPG73127.1 hypothetical protein FOA43_000432 [Brettanomyces nanus]